MPRLEVAIVVDRGRPDDASLVRLVLMLPIEGNDEWLVGIEAWVCELEEDSRPPARSLAMRSGV